MAEWYYAPEGRTEGPVPLESLVRLLHGAIPPDTPVWKEGFASWIPANTVPEISAHLPARPPAATQTVAAASAHAAAGGAGVATAAPAAAPAPDAPSLNPITIIRRSFSWRGRFTRGEYGVAILTGIVLTIAFYAIAGLVMLFAGPLVAGIVLVVLALPWLPVSFVLGFGSAVRRLNDLGASSWLLLLMFVPLVNLALLIYMLAAPSNPSAVLPTRTPVGAIVVLVLMLAFVVIGVLVGVLGGIAGVMGARVAANEASAIGRLRALNSAQSTYASVAAGGNYSTTVECLITPSACVPGYSGSESFISSDFAIPSQSGYVFALYGGAPAETPGGLRSASGTYAAVMKPESATTGTRTFCTDASGTIYDATALPADQVVVGAGSEAHCNPAASAIQ